MGLLEPDDRHRGRDGEADLTGAESTVARAAAWADDARLDADSPLPWGRAPGRVALWGYTAELLTHGWDLAVATDQPAEADPATATAVLAEAKLILPAAPRGGPVPFAAPVDPRPGAGPTEQLANWCGRG